MRKIIFTVLVVFNAITLIAKEKKVVYIVVDGIPADYIERLHPENIFNIAEEGNYSRAYTGGEVGGYSQTSTISAIGYMNILTGTWMNKHNVRGNSNLKPRYQYWSLFKIAKEQKDDYKTAIYSSWTDNRTVLIGEGKEETGNLDIDYVFDGYDLDKDRFPQKKDKLHIFDIDSLVAENAAQCIRDKAPDLNWVYLWYTDPGFHLYGDGLYVDKYVLKTDYLIGRIWESVKYREKHFDEEWLVIVTTDHGRDETGHNHGGQSERERGVWISTNYKKVNKHFNTEHLSLVDINPTICNYLGFEIPQYVCFEQDGIPFIGDVDIVNLTANYYDNEIRLNWDCYNKKGNVDIYVSFTNEYLNGKQDKWIKIDSVDSRECHYVFDKTKYPKSNFYKFAVVSSNNHLTRWCY